MSHTPEPKYQVLQDEHMAPDSVSKLNGGVKDFLRGSEPEKTEYENSGM